LNELDQHIDNFLTRHTLADVSREVPLDASSPDVEVSAHG